MLARCLVKTEALPPSVTERITLVQGDMTGFHLSRTFPLSIAPFRPIQHLTTVADQLAFLRCVREHLAPCGRLVFNAFNPNLAMLAAPINPDEVEDTPEQLLRDGRRMRRAYRIVRKRPAEQVNDIEMIWYLNGRRTVQCFPMRYLFRFEAEHLLALAGFKVTALHGGFDGSPFTDGSAEMIFTARA